MLAALIRLPICRASSHMRPFLHARERLRDDFFRMAETVDRGGVDPVDAEVDGFANGRDALGVVLSAPRERPPAAADGPRSEADRRDGEVRVAEPARLHDVLPAT